MWQVATCVNGHKKGGGWNKDFAFDKQSPCNEYVYVTSGENHVGGVVHHASINVNRERFLGVLDVLNDQLHQVVCCVLLAKRVLRLDEVRLTNYIEGDSDDRIFGDCRPPINMPALFDLPPAE